MRSTDGGSAPGSGLGSRALAPRPSVSESCEPPQLGMFVLPQGEGTLAGSLDQDPGAGPLPRPMKPSPHYLGLIKHDANSPCAAGHLLSKSKGNCFQEVCQITTELLRLGFQKLYKTTSFLPLAHPYLNYPRNVMWELQNTLRNPADVPCSAPLPIR